MAGKKRRGVGDISRYTGAAAQPPSFRDEPEDDTVASGTSFALVSLAVFMAISFAAVHFGTNNIESNLEARSIATLQASGFTAVDAVAEGTVVRLSGTYTAHQNEASAFKAVAAIAGVRSVEGKLWPAFSGELDEIEITGDAIEINWDGDKATVTGTVGAEERREFVSETLKAAFAEVDIEGLTILDDLVEKPRWLGATLGLLIRLKLSLPVGRMIVDPHNELLIVAGEVEDKDLRNEMNAKISDVAQDLGFDANPAIRLPKVGPTQEEIEELQFSLDDLIEGKVVEFESKSFELTENGTALLDEILAALRQAPEIRVKIAGHTDSRGTTTANQILSEQRADAVLEYLLSKGEPRERFDVIGYGESDPTASNETSDGRARNRRIEFTALDGQA